MHAVVRKYTGQGAAQLFDELERRTDDVERVIRGVTGVVSYALIRSGEGGMSVTICQDKAGADESVRAAAAWIKESVPASASPPEVTEGEVILQF